MTKPWFYVYALCRPDGRVFYVGKGQRNRMEQHQSEALSGRSGKKNDIIRDIISQGGRVGRIVLAETDDEERAYEEERRFIALYREHGLVNKTSGGGRTKRLSRKADIEKTLCRCRFCTPEIAEFLEA